MKRILLYTLTVLLISPAAFAGDKKAPVKREPAPAAADNKEIHWLTIDQLQQKMQENPRKVYMDVYTDWCGWCKKMEASTFTNPNLIKYVNNNFYAVRLNAERKDTINFMGKVYYYDAQNKVNTLAIELMKGKLSYPTSIVMMENFQNIQGHTGLYDHPADGDHTLLLRQ